MNKIYVELTCTQVLLVGNYKGKKVQDVKKEVQKEMIDKVSLKILFTKNG